MTPYQFFTRLETDLKSLVWEGTSNKIFGNAVFVVPELPVRQLAEFSAPSLFIIDQGAPSHPEHPGLLVQNFAVTCFIENVQNNMGRGGVLSSNRVANTSQGVGTLEMEEALLTYFIEKNELTTKINIIEKSKPKLQIMSNNNPLLVTRFVFRVLLSIY